MVRLARGSLPWLAGPPVVAFLFAAIGRRTGTDVWYWLSIGAMLVFLFFLAFFRDPQRVVANGLASPADGKVRAMETVVDADVGAADLLSIFMSPKDVHVNRMPLDGTVLAVLHFPGSHVPAFKKESERNERVEVLLDTAIGRVKVTLIAGTVARRIVPYIEEGQRLAKGQRIALIRFGSRCDLLVPEGRIRWKAHAGDQVQAAATSLGDLA
ncbi:MAG: phosphatidylserine decarboxylase [bacterium]